MGNIRMVVTDLDGTFLRSDKTISAYTAGVIRKLRQRGILFVAATARPVRAVKGVLPKGSTTTVPWFMTVVIKSREPELMTR